MHDAVRDRVMRIGPDSGRGGDAAIDGNYADMAVRSVNHDGCLLGVVGNGHENEGLTSRVVVDRSDLIACYGLVGCQAGGRNAVTADHMSLSKGT